ncbi:class I SAM-dependent methyltransferase, partial [Streptomyces sp. NRRL F-6492]|uniref:class I SAM-dependent methyltransferase n=1 Tax=Streptomyces sp. NRRL F-6492 TaxID=1519497 RepID=UPI0006C1CDDC
MTAGWVWDETLFAGAAPYYGRGRLPYAPGLVDVLAGVLGLDGRGRLLDVGCGPGTLALPLAHLFEEVVGVDPDGGMLAEARRGAEAAGAGGGTRGGRMRAGGVPGGWGGVGGGALGQSFPLVGP